MQAPLQDSSTDRLSLRTAICAEESRADYPICRERRLWRRLWVFTIISASIVIFAAWYTNELSYRWWMETARHDAMSGITYQNQPMYLRIEWRVDTIRYLDARLHDNLPRPFARLIHLFSNVLETYSVLHDPARFVVIIAVVNVTVYLMSWTQQGEYLISRYLLHSGLSGKTYTVFTTAYVHKMWWHLLLNMASLWVVLPGLFWLSENNDGGTMWNFTLPQLLAFYTIGGFGYFFPTVLAQTFHRKHVRSLPLQSTIQGALPLDIPFAFRVCLGASPGVYAVWVLYMFSIKESIDVGPISLHLRDFIIPSLLFECAVFYRMAVGTPQHICGAFFGFLYVLWGDDMRTGWDWIRRLAGNQHTLFTRRLADTVLSDGTIRPSYDMNLFEAALPRW